MGGALLITVAPPAAALAVRWLAASLRIVVRGADRLVPLWRERRPLIYAVWHGRILMVPWLNARLRETHGARAVRVLASRSRDGEIVTRYVRYFGLDVVRGSSSRGGAVALRRLAATLAAGDDVAVIPDGPRGPRCRLQPGIVALAALSGAPVVPLAFAGSPAWRLSSWDEFLIPMPFARCALVFGEPAAVTRDADRERAGKDLEATLLEVTSVADRLVAR